MPALSTIRRALLHLLLLSGVVGVMQLDALQALTPALAQRQGLQAQAAQGISLVALVLGSVSFVLWLGLREARLYLWHALTCVFGSLYGVAFLVEQPFLPAPLWHILHAMCLGGFATSGAFVGLHYICIEPPRWWRLHLRAAVLLATILCASALFLSQEMIYRAVLPALLFLGATVGLHSTWEIWILKLLRRPDATAFWMLQSVLQVGAAAIHDAVLLAGHLSDVPAAEFIPAGTASLYFSYATALPLMTFTWVVLQRYVAAFREAETLNRELADRVAERERQIERSYLELRRAEQDRAVAEERERLFADMHDGLGGTLVAALARLDNEGALDSVGGRAMQSALDDLRLVLSSADPQDHSPRAAFGVLRDRLSAACEDAGVALQFDLRDLPDDLQWPSRVLLHVLRIVQEACTNALRHAGPKNLRVVVTVASDVQVLIEDNGRGMAPDLAAKPGHHGLPNMRRRAERLNGTVVWHSAATGTRVELRIPAIAPETKP